MQYPDMAVAISAGPRYWGPYLSSFFENYFVFRLVFDVGLTQNNVLVLRGGGIAQARFKAFG